MHSKTSYPGQGNPLPPSMGQGQWIVENLASISTGEVNFTALPPEVRSELVEFGYVHFEAKEVAAAMGVTVEELLRANETGQLRLENKSNKPGPGRLFRLSFGERYCVALIDRPAAANGDGGENDGGQEVEGEQS